MLDMKGLHDFNRAVASPFPCYIHASSVRFFWSNDVTLFQEFDIAFYKREGFYREIKDAKLCKLVLLSSLIGYGFFFTKGRRLVHKIA